MESSIDKTVTLESKVADYMQVKVKVDSKNSCKVIVASPPAQDKSISTSSQLDKINGFHTALNCNFAYLAMNSIYEFVNLSPLLYQYKFQYYNDIYKEELGPKFEEYFNRLQNYVENFNERGIILLNNVLDSNTNIVYYRDTSTLEALKSLRMKIGYLTQIISPQTKQAGPLHFMIIRLVLNDMSKIQRYFSINCYGVLTESMNSLWYGYNVDTTGADRSPMVEFFNVITKNEKLVGANRQKCSLDQIILNSVFPLSTEDQVDFKNDDLFTKTFINVTNNAPKKNIDVTLQYIFRQVHTSYYNSEVIFWYQQFIIVIIMKIIFTTIINGLNTDVSGEIFRKSISDGIININNIISENYTSYPEYFVDGFTILGRIAVAKNDLDLKEITQFHDSLPMDDIALNYNIPKDSTSFLKNVFNNIQNEKYSLQCFQEFHKTLRDKHQKYFIPFINNKSILLSESTYLDEKHFQRVCDFLKNVYSLCFLAVMFLQEDFMDDFYGGMEKKIPDFSKRLPNILKIIQHYFLLIIKKRSHDVGLLKMAYAIAPLLVNSIKKIENNSDIGMDSVLDLIMAELNIYGTNYCNTPRTNFSLINTINFYNLGNQEMVDQSMKDFYQFSVTGFVEEDLNVKSINLNEFNYLDVEFFFTRYVKFSDLFKKYENIILFYWNGGFRTIQSVFQSNFSYLKTVNDLYHLYDMYFKFHGAAFYYELKKISIKKNLSQINNEFKNIRDKMKNGLRVDVFPQGLKPFILDINNLLKVNLDANSKKTHVNVQTDKIDMALNKFNIIFNNGSTIFPSCFSSSVFPFELFDESSINIVEQINNYFTSFHK